MSGKEQRRAWILTKLLVGELNVAEAAVLMQLRPVDLPAVTPTGPKSLAS